MFQQRDLAEDGVCVNVHSQGDPTHFIGLKRGSSPCTCSRTNDTECLMCQRTWVWEDNKPMIYTNWAYEQHFEPQNDDCGRLSWAGWLGQDCASPLGYICKRTVSFNNFRQSSSRPLDKYRSQVLYQNVSKLKNVLKRYNRPTRSYPSIPISISNMTRQ